MRINDATIDLIKAHEGLRLSAYPDPAYGWKVPTIGYGHTSMAGEPSVYKGLSISTVQAEAILRKDLQNVLNTVIHAIKVPVNANQVGALVSFTFNLGARNFNKSTLLKKLNAGDYAGAAKEFKRWNKAGGKILPGLVRRRKEEAELFLTPVKRDPAVDDAKPATTPKPRPTAPRMAILAILAALGVAIGTYLKSKGIF